MFVRDKYNNYPIAVQRSSDLLYSNVLLLIRYCFIEGFLPPNRSLFSRLLPLKYILFLEASTGTEKFVQRYKRVIYVTASGVTRL